MIGGQGHTTVPAIFPASRTDTRPYCLGQHFQLGECVWATGVPHPRAPAENQPSDTVHPSIGSHRADFKTGLAIRQNAIQQRLRQRPRRKNRTEDRQDRPPQPWHETGRIAIRRDENPIRCHLALGRGDVPDPFCLVSTKGRRVAMKGVS